MPLSSRCLSSSPSIPLPFLLWIPLLVVFGCGKKNPVEMVSADQSGVEIREVASVGDSDWNAWRGPRFDGVAADQPVATEWDEKTNVLWKTDIPGRGHGSPIVVGDAVFVATADENKSTQSVIRLDRADGSGRWETVIHKGGFPSPGEIHKKATNANGTIACDGQRLYIGMFNSDSIIATALSLDGEILWQQPIGKFVSKFGYAPSPILYKSFVILA
ncbi:MAG: PQQ-binding-like beta-propeller repeat protein, partial [Rubripirellula sp.]